MSEQRGYGRQGNEMDDLELPPPPVSPPREPSPSSAEPPPPGYEPPNIEQAKEFRLENLPRRLPDLNQRTKYRLTRPGEKCSEGEQPRLYSILESNKSLDEFGLGVGLYFRELRTLGLVIFLCCVIYLPTMIHHVSFNGDDIPVYLKGTAINASRSDLSLSYNGVPDIIVTLLLLLFCFVARKIEKEAIVEIDINQQTPQDYSVCIHNPPDGPESLKPDYYKDIFSRYGEIVFVTIVLNNGQLMKMVARKRVLEHKLQALKSRINSNRSTEEHWVHKSKDELPTWQAFIQPLGFFNTQDYLEEQLKETVSLLDGLTNRVYKVKRVYITFNTEGAQRDCLKAVETGVLAQHFQQFQRDSHKDSTIGDKVVFINEAEEPSEIKWENLHLSRWQRVSSILVSIFLSMCFLAGGFFTLAQIPTGSNFFAAIFISVINAILPFVARVLTMFVERHKSLTDLQQSMMFKLVLTRIVNSAFLLYLVTDTVDQLDEDTLTSVLSILVADAFTTPVLRLLNVYDFFVRKFIAPKAKTQAEMNVFFQGADWNLAERYTDVIKTLFVGLFYSAIVPTGLLVTLTSMVTIYWVDKYSLLRLWKRPPSYDASLSVFARKYILFIVWVHLVSARIFFAYWPNEDENQLPNCEFFSCNYEDGEENFYTEDQDEIVSIYEVLGALLFVLGGIFLVLWYLRYYINKLLCKRYQEVGQPTSIQFRDVSGIDVYVPLINVNEMVDPLLAIDVKDMSENAHKYLPLRMGGFYDAAHLSMNSENDFPNLKKEIRDSLFGRVQYYPAAGEVVSVGGGGFLYETGSYNDRYQVQPLPPLIRASSRASFAVPSGGKLTGIMDLPVRRPQGLSSHAPSSLRPMEEGDDYDLPHGWEMRTTGTGRVYYVCHATRTTQWKRPSIGLAHHGRSYQGGRGGGDGRGDWAFRRGKELEASSADLHSAMMDLTPGFEVRYTNTGRPYYVDHNMGKTQWEHPKLMQAKANVAAALAERQASMPQSGGGSHFVERYTSAGVKYYTDITTNRDYWSPPRGRSTTPHLHDDRRGSVGGRGSSGGEEVTGLPAGWESRITNMGRVYYVNHDQRITQWNPPGVERLLPHPHPPTSSHASTPLVPPAPPSMGGSTTTQSLSNGLPGDQGRRGRAGGEGEKSLELPGHIEIRTTPEGRQYYVNHKNKTTLWMRPTPDQW